MQNKNKYQINNNLLGGLQRKDQSEHVDGKKKLKEKEL